MSQGQSWVCNSEHTLEKFIEHAKELQEEKGYVVFKWSFDKPRTPKQQAAIEVYCREVAEEFERRGITVQAVMEISKRGIPWTQESIKEVIVKNVMEGMFGITSTTELNTKQWSQLYEALNEYVLSPLGVYVPIPERKE